MECPECYAYIDYYDQPHNCPCPEDSDEGFIDDWELSDEELEVSDEEN